MIDWTRVEALRDEIGPEYFAEVAELFLMEVEDTLSRLTGAENDSQAMRDLMHFLKGSALNLGFSQLAETCSAAEIAAAQGRTDANMPCLKSLYEQSRLLFEAEFAQRFAA